MSGMMAQMLNDEPCPRVDTCAELAALRADNARLRGVLDKIQSGTLGLPDSVMEEGPAATWQWMWVESQKAARAALSALAPAGDEALFQAIVNHNPDIMLKADAERFVAMNGGPAIKPAGAFVTLEQLREWRGTIEQLQTVQYGCPLPSYEEAFRLANMEAANSMQSLAAAIRDAEVKP
jgi:hypothetical protein